MRATLSRVSLAAALASTLAGSAASAQSPSPWGGPVGTELTVPTMHLGGAQPAAAPPVQFSAAGSLPLSFTVAPVGASCTTPCQLPLAPGPYELALAGPRQERVRLSLPYSPALVEVRPGGSPAPGIALLVLGSASLATGLALTLVSLLGSSSLPVHGPEFSIASTVLDAAGAGLLGGGIGAYLSARPRAVVQPARLLPTATAAPAAPPLSLAPSFAPWAFASGGGLAMALRF